MEHLIKEFGEIVMEKLSDKILQHSLEQNFGYDIEYHDDYFALKYNKKNIEPNEMGISFVCIESEFFIKNKKYKYNKEYCSGDYNQLKIMDMLNKNSR